jgi:cell surface protein SprA
VPNYQLGRGFQILDPSLQASNTPIEVSLENNSVWSANQKILGVKCRKSFQIIFWLVVLENVERPFHTNQVGQESGNNTIFWIQYLTSLPKFL